MKTKLLILALSIFTLSVFSQGPSISTALAIDATNTSATITFSEAVFQADGSTQLTATQLVPTIASGTATLTSYTVSTTDDTTFTFALTLSGISDGAEVLTLSGTVYDSASNDTAISTTASLNDLTAPALTEVTVIVTPGNSATPSYVFNTDEAGTITSSLGFSTPPSAIVGNNTITFNNLADGNYSGETLTVTDNAGNTAILILSDFLIDTILPEIILRGTTTISSKVGTVYIDAGATALDNIDGDISPNIVLGGETVDINTVGSYTITYNVTDAATNAALEATRTVNVINDKIVTLAVSETTIAENESFTVSASISSAHATDIFIDLTNIGDAKYSSDFTSNTEVRIQTVAGGSSDSNNNQTLRYPRGVYADNEGNLYVAQIYDGNIKKYAPGDLIGEILISGLSQPIDVSVAVNGDIYVLEHEAHRVTKFSSDGSGGIVVAGKNGYGAELDQLYNPSSFFIDTAGNIYIADSRNHRIQKWAPGAEAGITVAGGNGGGWELNKLGDPRGVTLDPQGNIYVADGGYGRIQKWAPGATQGETVLEGLQYTTDIFLDVNGNMYVLEASGHVLKKYSPNSTYGSVVAGGQVGSSANNLNRPENFFVDEIGNIYVSDSENNRVQKYDASPQLVIAAGETVAELLFSGIQDTKDELDETIILNTSVTNAILESAAALTVNLIDINDAPSVAFTFSEDSIKENSNTDVTLTATLSSVSGKPVEMEFTMEGTAVEVTDYVLSSNTITIPANSLSGTITISTADIAADGEVEALDTIIFNVETISNATATEDSATLFLESIESPEVVLVVSQTTIAENETFNVIATLNAAASKNVIINLNSAGVAKYNSDFTSNSEVRITTVAGGSVDSNNNQILRFPRGNYVDNEGNLYVAEIWEGKIKKYTPGDIEGETLISGLSQPIDVSVAANGDIYVLEQEAHRVIKFSSNGSGGAVVAGGNGSGSELNQLYNATGFFIDTAGNIYIADTENHRIQKWAPGAITGVTVAGGNGSGGELNQLYNPRGVTVDPQGNVYVADEAYGRIQKWATGAIQGETVIQDLRQPQSVSLDATGNLYVLERDNHSLKKYLPNSSTGILVAGGQRGSSANNLNYPQNFFVDEIGNIYVSDSENNRVQKYDFSPQLVIKSGETAAELLFSGIRDTRDENDETIILNPSVTNADLTSAAVLTVNLTDINDAPSVAFTFSEDSIKENSNTDVTLTATLSSVSGKPVEMEFTMEGTAVEVTDYVLSSNTITIPANSLSGTITVSTSTIAADGLVEVMDTIIFTVTDISNATATEDSATLYLESIENPEVVLTVSQESIAENETFNVIATLSDAASKDVIINLNSVGVAKYNSDFTSNSEVRITTVAGDGSDNDPSVSNRYPRGNYVDDAGNLYVAQMWDGYIKKYAPGDLIGEILITGLSQPIDVSVAVNGDIYVLEEGAHKVTKWSSDGSGGTVVAGGNSYGSELNQLYNPSGFFIDTAGNIYIADSQNHRIQKWAPGATEGVTVAGGNGEGGELNKLGNPRGVTLDLQGNIYVVDGYYGRIQKWAPGAIQGTTVLNGLNDATDIFVDAVGNLYVLEASGHVLKKYSPNSSTGIIVAGGERGSSANNLNQPGNFFVDEIGNIYVSDSDNHRVQKYVISPQLVVKAGETVAELLFSGLEDTRNEDDETIILNTNITNGILASTDALSVKLTDASEVPTLKFEFNEDKITETSITDVTLTATLSAVSGKEVIVEFTMGGTAEELIDYKLSSKIITIPADSPTGTITISTAEIGADGAVEVLDTIIFTVKDITNATAETDSATLFLESNESPNVVLSASRETIAEHETFNIVATLDAATSKDVVVGLKSIGTAIYDADFKRNSIIEIQTVAGGNGYGSAKNQVARPRGIFTTVDGSLYVADEANGRIQKWAPGAKEGQTIVNDLNSPRDVFVDLSGNIYSVGGDGRAVIKTPFGTTNKEVVAGTYFEQGQASDKLANAQSIFVDLEGNVFIADYSNNRIQKWRPGATEGETVATGSIQVQGIEDSDLRGPLAITMDLEGNLLIIDDELRVVKWVPGAETGETIISYNEANNYFNTYPKDIEVDSEGNIFVLIESYDNNWNQQYSILRHDNAMYEATTVAGGNGIGSEPNQLNEARNFTIDALGNIYISDQGNKRVQRYEFSLQVKVKAGETTGALVIAGIEDELNDEGEELIVFTKTLASNAILNDTDELSVTLLDNRITMTLKDSPFLGLSEGAVSWGDYDKDGDKDVAVMGQSSSLGAVTILYQNNAGVFENTEQNFVNVFGGDITWVDLNKDGYIDLVVSGYDGVLTTPSTKVYINTIVGPSNIFIEPSEGYELPQLFSTKMAWGDLDNDGDIDLAIAGQDAEDNFVFNVYFKDDTTNNYIKDDGFGYEGNGFINGDLKIVDRDLDGDNDIIYTGEDRDGYAIGGTVFNTYIKATNNYNNYYNNYTPGLKNSAIEVAKLSVASNNISVLSSGEDNDGNIKLFLDGDENQTDRFPTLKNGDLAVADYNNDGKNDILFTGENQSGVPVTKLFKQVPASSYSAESYDFKDSGIELIGLRASTANWVDYDMDGDLDLFLTGVGESGAETLLYQTEVANKKNNAPSQITGLELVDLGNGNVRFNWDLPEDDYATNLGYVIRVGTTPGGTELSNTESDLVTGERLISKAPPIYNNFYDMQLDPGNYYWSVQAVDPGLKGGVFSDENAFTLVYEWKILNQGGIVDRTVGGVNDPVIKLGDVDNDDDLDIIYGSKSNGNAQLLKYDGTQLIRDDNSPLQYISNVTNTEVGDINGDGIADILVNTANGSNYDLNIYLSSDSAESNSGPAESNYNAQYVGEGLFNAKARIVDLNNDGQAEIFLVGMSSSSLSGVPKLYLYEYNVSPADGDGYFVLNDVSDQIAALQYASYDLGDVDNDQDIDFVISGFSAQNGSKTFVYENITELGGAFTLEQTSNNLVAVKNGTTDFIDFDGDGDLDAVFTGESKDGDVFEIYMNTINDGNATFSKLPNSLAPMREGKIDLGDFNGDGYADLLYSGTFSGSGDITKLNEYDANTKTYVDSAFDVSDIIKAEVEFGDLDGDGDLDFVIAGKSNDVNSDNVFRTYINVRNQSATVLAGKSSSKRPEYRGKNAAKYRSEQNFTVNSAPSAPVINDIVFLDEAEGSVDIPLEFSWNEATDDHTPNIGLTYALKIGTTPGGEEIMSSNSNANGVKKDAEKGNVEHNLKWKLSLPEGTYYWSVQAVDASYSGSIFSEPVQFRVTTSGIDTDSDGDGIENSLDTCPNTPAGDAVNDQGCSVNAILGDGNGDTTVNVTDLVVSVNYILGNNPTPFVFKAADVNNDDLIDVRDIVGIVDIILSETGDKSSESNKSTAFYSNTPIGDALFSWEGNDLYVSTDKEIAGMQLVFDKEFRYQVSESLASFNTLNFGEGSDNTLMIYSFSETSITPGKTKVLTKFEDGAVDLNIKKSAVGAKKGLTLAVKFTPVVPDQLEAFLLGPNPSSGQMNLFYNLPKEMDMLLLNVYNVNGSKVWSSDKIKTMVGAQTTPLNLSFLSNGVYFIRIEEYSKGVLKQNEVKRLIIKK